MNTIRQLPANFGPLKGAQANARVTGPCGDTMEFWLRIENDRILQATFTTDGCGASIASGSLTASLAEGQTLIQAGQLEPETILNQLGGLPEDHRHCPVLAVKTLQAALENYPAQESCEGQAESGQVCAHHAARSGAPAVPIQPANGRDETGQGRQTPSARLSRIAFTLMVLSGKGGVGKSTVAVNLAAALAEAGKRVGILDVDMHGPSIPMLLGIKERPVTDPNGEAILPIVCRERLKAMSMGLLLKDAREAIIWRGPMKYNAIRELMTGVAWGDLDVLIIDAPPGTGDEPLAVAQMVAPPAAAIVVTTPQQVAVADVRRSLTFCEQAKLNVLGLIENMSGYACPKCGETQSLFKQGGGQALAAEMNVPFLGCIPLDPLIVDSGDNGTPFVDGLNPSPTANAFRDIVVPILKKLNAQQETASATNHPYMKIAIPLVNGRLSEHFGHCEQFALVEVNPEAKTIVSQKQVVPPPHEPGVLPRWLHEQGVLVIIAGGMGQRAINLFNEYGITVKTGAPGQTPELLAQAYLRGELTASVAACSQQGNQHGCHH
jgi:ATP-binding protein involved in chromosome partitioning